MSQAREASSEIDDKAAAWAARTDRGLSADESAALDAWLASDARHVGAFAKARAVSLHADRVRALGPHFDAEMLSPLDRADSIGAILPWRKERLADNRLSRRAVWMGAAAAAAAGLVVAVRITPRTVEGRPFATRVGETRVIPLEDGSLVTLNTQSDIAVRYSTRRRDIHLISGEALFDVAKDKTRPFIVEAGDTQVRAVGTSFTVKLLPDEPVLVLVREGVVEVRRPGVPTAPTVRLAAGNRALAPSDAPIVAAAIGPTEVDRALAWRIGRLAFEGETLRQAAADFARYSDTRIVIDDPAIADKTITGLFVSNDPVGFAKAVAISLNLHAEVSGGEVRLSR